MEKPKIYSVTIERREIRSPNGFQARGIARMRVENEALALHQPTTDLRFVAVDTYEVASA